MTDGLAETDDHHWWPVPSMLAWVAANIADGAKVLDVGPNESPLDQATVLADILPCTECEPHQQFVLCEVGADRLPFPDKHFDFVYCRHALEDMADPFAAMREIERVGKAGYIETPSPIAELCRGVDSWRGGWRGYSHHHWIVWSHDGELNFVSKFSVIEHAKTSGDLADLLRGSARYWNTYHPWKDKIRFVHRKSPTHYEMPREYPKVLNQAIQQSQVSSDEFWLRVQHELTARAA